MDACLHRGRLCGRGGVEEEFTLYRFTETKLCMLVQAVVPTLEWLSQDL